MAERAVRIFDVVRPLVALVLGLVLGASVTAFAGENPLHVLSLLGLSAFGSLYDVGMSLFYATPLLFTGLSVALAFRGGLFNIGAEGQLVLGAMAAAAVGIVAPGLPPPVALPLAFAAAFVAGAAWGAIPGALKAWRGSHEVITTIMLNFVAAGIVSYVTLYVLRNPSEQSPETLPVGEGFRLPALPGFEDAPVSAALLVGLVGAVAVGVLLARTVTGFRIRAVGENESAAARAAIGVGRMRVATMALAGGVAGLAGLFDVLGPSGRFKLGFSADYGFTGIAVALLGRSRPLGVVGAALLFGALHKGAADLDFETENVTRDLATVLQAMVILTVCADGLWDAWRSRLTRRKATAA
jgi:simple sugar transport system permease protein